MIPAAMAGGTLTVLWKRTRVAVGEVEERKEMLKLLRIESLLAPIGTLSPLPW